MSASQRSHVQARMVIIVASTTKKPVTMYGAALVSSAADEPLLEPVAVAEELVPLAVPVTAADPLEVNAVSVAAAAKSCSDEYVTQFEEAGMMVWYGGDW